MKFLTYLLFFLVSISTDLSARESISIVGSSTVYPFSITVAEEFGRRNDSFKSPIVESTGSGGGLTILFRYGPQ